MPPMPVVLLKLTLVVIVAWTDDAPTRASPRVARILVNLFIKSVVWMLFDENHVIKVQARMEWTKLLNLARNHKLLVRHQTGPPCTQKTRMGEDRTIIHSLFLSSLIG